MHIRHTTNSSPGPNVNRVLIINQCFWRRTSLSCFSNFGSSFTHFACVWTEGLSDFPDGEMCNGSAGQFGWRFACVSERAERKRLKEREIFCMDVGSKGGHEPWRLFPAETLKALRRRFAGLQEPDVPLQPECRQHFRCCSEENQQLLQVRKSVCENQNVRFTSRVGTFWLED